MSLVKRGKFWHYHFFVAGQRYRGSTKQTVEGKARLFESTMIAEIRSGIPSAIPGKAPTLRDYSTRFLNWVENTTDLKPATRKYYRYGVAQLLKTRLAGMRLDSITTDTSSMVTFDGSAAWGNQARRALSRILHHAVAASVIRIAPAIHLQEEFGREGIMDDHAEKKLLFVAPETLADVILIIRDMGLRPNEVFRMRWEHVDWDKRQYFNPHGKSRKARRWVPLSQRVVEALAARKARQGKARNMKVRDITWVFPSARAKGGHLTTVAKQFRQARRDAGLPDWLVLYHARHAFGTYIMAETKNPALVRDAMGHADLRTTMIYQHPELEPLRNAIDARNERVM